MSASTTLIERGEAAHKELKKLRFRFVLGSWITGIVGIAILALLTGYFVYGYSEISDFKDPNYIVSLVGNLIDDQIPQARQTLQNQVDTNAGAWAQQASDQIVAYIPSLREQLEDFASQQVDKALDQVNFLGEKEFRRVLNENRDTVTKALKDLEDDHEISEGVLLLLEKELAEALKMDADALAGTPLVMVSDLNKSGKLLLKGENLSEEQQHERRVLMIVRRLQQVQFGDAKLQAPKISPEIAGSLEQLEHASLDKEKEAAAKAAKEAVEKPAEAAKEEAAKPAEAAADKPAAAKAPEAKAENAAQPEAAKAEAPEKAEAEAPKKAEAEAPSDEKKVAEAKPADT